MTPEQEEQVRRALGSLPSEGPVPPEVARRLDARLADLVAERDAGSAGAAVSPEDAGAERDDLAARRRRRRWRTGLVAAASVAVLGVGLGTVVDDLSLGGGDSESTTAGAADHGSAAPETASGDVAGGRVGGETEARRRLTDGTQYLAREPQDLSSATLDSDVARVAGLGPVLTAGPEASAEGGRVPGGESPPRGLVAITACDLPPIRAGDQVVPVRLDGERATLVLRGDAAGAREAQIYSCDDGDVLLASTVVPLAD